MRILVVDAEGKLRRSLWKLLRNEGYAVDEAPDGERGLYLARVNDYDIVILDNVLPGKTGLEVPNAQGVFFP